MDFSFNIFMTEKLNRFFSIDLWHCAVQPTFLFTFYVNELQKEKVFEQGIQFAECAELSIPKQRSAKFLMRMLVTFLLLTEPASRKPKPACMKMMREPMRTRKKLSRLCLRLVKSMII